MEFKAKHFDPLKSGGTRLDDGSIAFRAGDRPQDVYVYKPKTILAINVALATKRPLLISGEPGSGKSTLAQNVAAVLGWWYYKQMITSRIQASDLLWTFDTLRRLSDATTPGQLLSRRHYIEPGTLWWAFDPETARHRGKSEKLVAKAQASDPGTPPPAGKNARTVVLLDEIDKADPDVPNDLLEPVDLLAFTVRETNERIEAERELLLILTTNGERELPPAFLRRCVSLTLDPPTRDWFVSIAEQRFGAAEDGLHAEVADEVIRLRKAAKKIGAREPSAAEYLDALAVCRELTISTTSQAWADTARTVLWKDEREPEAETDET